MIKAPIGPNEAERQARLNTLDVLDSDAEAAYDEITKLASIICESPISLVAFLDGDRNWFKSKHGVDLIEAPREESFCGHAIQQDDLFEIQDASLDERFHDNPIVVSAPNIRFYAGYPLPIDGENIGTLCVFDVQPKKLSDEQKYAMKALSHAVASLLKLRKAVNDMAVISDNVKTGLIAFDQDLNVLDGFSRECTKIFLERNITGEKIDQLMFNDDSERQAFAMGVEQVFADFMPEEATIGQLPSDFTIGDKVYQAKYSVVRNSKNEIVNILATIEEITELIASKKEAVWKNALFRIATDKNSFALLLAEFSRDINRAKSFLEKNETSDVRKILHTFKGNFLSIGLQELGAMIHDIEGQSTIELSHLSAIEENMNDVKLAIEDTLGIVFGNGDQAIYEVSENYIAKLEKFISDYDEKDENANFLRDWVNEVTTFTTEKLTEHFRERALQLAKKLDKKVSFEIVNKDLIINPKPLRGILKNLIHAVNNAVDHGIEAPSERSDKPEQGIIRLTFSKDQNDLTIKLEDDGRGIDSSIMRKVAVKKGIMTESEATKLSDQEAIELVFSPDFSSKEDVSEISGRGVGMGALKDAAIEAGGTISLSSQPGRGTVTTITLKSFFEPVKQSSTSEAAA
ncbi:ATP-binding protein [Pseudobacteriovorax antillogorgiicola]|uniref:histidine kinase n=1 Tax=Pseudobacteriovorax antillogorgiicola TaxID=1513793 RepID=A0A1Y6BTX5_9BACT|nr:ATP-binding protein [Pseudobacteriovorax antillogorgiicola]TCS54576.1 two-component system chemotaxis sensor kinase CheA [Pseudobacteriovorax antillogorgiicola]SMF17989.1 two-component system, chemotaxis family, sensor kinase CheA [Pseudobacteriovorax antillogorgiicola]